MQLRNGVGNSKVRQLPQPYVRGIGNAKEPGSNAPENREDKM